MSDLRALVEGLSRTVDGFRARVARRLAAELICVQSVISATCGIMKARSARYHARCVTIYLSKELLTR